MSSVALLGGRETPREMALDAFPVVERDSGEHGKGKDRDRICLETSRDTGEHVLKGGDVQIQ